MNSSSQDTKEFKAKDWPCKKCKVPNVWYTSEESFDGGDDLFHYHCHTCGYRWDVWCEYD